MAHNANSSFIFLLRVLLLGTKVPDHYHGLGVIGQGQHIFIIFLMARNANSSFISDQGCSYLAHQFPMVCSLQHVYLITDSKIKSKVKVKYT